MEAHEDLSYPTTEVFDIILEFKLVANLRSYWND